MLSIEITCPELVVPENGYTAFSTDLDAPYDLGVTATYSCADGFSMENGDSERTCGYDGGSTVGQWSGDAPVCVGEPTNQHTWTHIGYWIFNYDYTCMHVTVLYNIICSSIESVLLM